MTLLEVAALNGNVDAVQQLLDAQPGPNINHQDAIGKYSYPNISNYLKSIFLLAKLTYIWPLSVRQSVSQSPFLKILVRTTPPKRLHRLS